METPKAQPDSAGLQYAGYDDAPEAVAESAKRSSLCRPEVIIPNEYQGYNGHAGESEYHNYGAQHSVRAYYGTLSPYGSDADKDISEKGKYEKTIFGLRRRAFFWMLAIVILIVIIAAVLSGVLATVLADPDSEDNSSDGGDSTSSSFMPLSINKNTGSAVVKADDGSSLYSFYQDPQGRVIENRYSDGKWSIEGSDVPNHAVVATDAQDGSPLAATSWSSKGETFRQIFYIDYSGMLKTSNTTGTKSWPASYSILPHGDAAIPNSRALSVISDTDSKSLNGIRVYFASTNNLIQECGLDFDGPNAHTWNLWAKFPESDIHSGAASVLYCTENHLYLRNKTTNRIQQWTWDYADPTEWKMGAQGPTMPSSADITATGDGETTDHIFYENEKGELVRALYFGTSITDFINVATVVSGSKLSSYYDLSGSQNGAVVYYRNESDGNAISYQDISRTGQTVLSGFVS